MINTLKRRVSGLFAPEIVGIRGHGFADLWSEEGYKAHKAGDPLALHGDLAHIPFTNLITDYGDQYYGERAANIGTPPAQVTGMQLGTGTTAVAKTGAGAAMVIVASTNDSNIAIDATWPQSSQPGGAGTARRIQWKTTWPAGTTTLNSLSEVCLHNQTVTDETAVVAGETISRALISPVVNKAAGDTLAITWNHDLLGA